jgi:hypothetical protein
LVEGTKDVGLTRPECKDIGGAGREDEVELEPAGDFIENGWSIDGLGPGLGSMERGEDGLEFAFIAEFVLTAKDLTIEDFDADIEFTGFEFANAVVIESSERSQAIDDGLVRFGGRRGFPQVAPDGMVLFLVGRIFGLRLWFSGRRSWGFHR